MFEKLGQISEFIAPCKIRGGMGWWSPHGEEALYPLATGVAGRGKANKQHTNAAEFCVCLQPILRRWTLAVNQGRIQDFNLLGGVNRGDRSKWCIEGWEIGRETEEFQFPTDERSGERREHAAAGSRGEPGQKTDFSAFQTSQNASRWAVSKTGDRMCKPTFAGFSEGRAPIRPPSKYVPGWTLAASSV